MRTHDRLTGSFGFAFGIFFTLAIALGAFTTATAEEREDGVASSKAGKTLEATAVNSKPFVDSDVMIPSDTRSIERFERNTYIDDQIIGEVFERSILELQPRDRLVRERRIGNVVALRPAPSPGAGLF